MAQWHIMNMFDAVPVAGPEFAAELDPLGPDHGTTGPIVHLAGAHRGRHFDVYIYPARGELAWERSSPFGVERHSALSCADSIALTLVLDRMLAWLNIWASPSG